MAPADEWSAAQERVIEALTELMRRFVHSARSLHHEQEAPPGVRALGGMGGLQTLFLIEAHPDLTAGDLARLTGLSLSAVTGLVNRLEELGLASRRRDRRDRREVHLDLTEAGRSLAEQARRWRAEALRPWFASLSTEELNLLAEILPKVVRTEKVER